LATLLRRPPDGIALNEHYSGDGAIIYRHACALGCEGEAPGLTVSGRSRRQLVEGQEPGGAGGDARAEEEWN
jgi:hypothetical protein